MSGLRLDDLIITIAYFSIPIQIAVSLLRYPRLSNMPTRIYILAILFALFIFLCGTGHLMKCSGYTGTLVFEILNGFTAFISMATALYLLPLVPNLMETIDKGLIDIAIKDELEATKRKLMTFMAFLCHEIRNPLFAITSTISLLEEGDDALTPGQEKAVRSINHSACLMLRIVNDVLDLGRLESGKLELESRCFDLRELLQNVASSTVMMIEQKHKHNVQFHFQMSDDIPQTVCGDSARLLQIVYNLLSNAIKFTEEGHVDFNVSLGRIEIAEIETPSYRNDRRFIEEESFVIDCSEGSRSMNGSSHSDDAAGRLEAAEAGEVYDAGPCEVFGLLISISDTGPGIPKENIHHIFEPYCQSKLSDFRKHGGTGLGLAIITKIVRIMGGTIKVKSVIGEGSTFKVYVPISVPSNDAGIHVNEGKGTTFPVPSACSSAATDVSIETSSTKSQQEAQSRSHGIVNEALITMSGQVRSLSSGSLNNCTSLQRGQVPSSKKLNLSKFDFPPNDCVVLVVDDNSMNCKLIVRMLQHYNVQSDVAFNGQEAIDKVLQSRNVSPDSKNAPYYGLILMDMQMPVLDGCEATKILRQRYNVTIPIVALTANALDSHRDVALTAGVTEFATKPISIEELHTKCGKYLRKCDEISDSTLYGE